jgi:fumarate reductase subunit D
MNTDRRAILSLIAMGRITPREAERLLAILSDWDDAIVRVAVVCAVAWMVVPHVHHGLMGVSQAFDVVSTRLFAAGHHVLTSVSNVFEGAL